MATTRPEASPTPHEASADLRAELHALRERVERQERRLADRDTRRRRPRARFLATLSAALLLALVPLSILAANPFTDLVPGSPHNDDIDLIYGAGITKGCVPDQQYCPTENVTRQEMASFLARVAGLGANKPVVNAAEVDGRSANELVRLGGKSRSTPELLTSDWNDYLLVEITAPGRGYVLVTGNVTIADINDGCVNCDIEMRLGQAQGNAFGPVLHEDIASDEISMAGSYVFQVDGGTQTFALQARKTDPGGNVNALRGALTALYVPYGGSGLGPL
ncbi:MAG TPA: S-layer homology domain-containing protein, partial [Thermomicrobiales bacterium]